MNIYELTQVQSANELSKVFTHAGLLVSSEGTLRIIKINENTQLDVVKKLELSEKEGLSFQLKGLIYDFVTGLIVAPGVLIPSNTEQLDLDNLKDKIDYITPAQDGVMFRLYKHNGSWLTSTNGMITPNRGWGPRGSRSFLDLFTDLGFDTSKLIDGLCYYVVMEHSEQTNIVKHTCNTLTLTRIVEVDTLRDLDSSKLREEAERLGLKVLQRTQSASAFTDALSAHQTKCLPSVVTSDEVGSILHLKDGRVFRLETWKYMHAASLKPNVADPRHQWVQLATLSQNTISNAADRIKMHVLYFPWDEECFKSMSELLTKLVSKLFDDYNQIYAHGFKSVTLDSRHVKFQHEMALAFPEGINVQDLEHYLLQQAPARIYFLMNPDNLQPQTSSVLTL